MSINIEYNRTSCVLALGLTAGLLFGCGSQTPASNNLDTPAETDTTDTNTETTDEVSDTEATGTNSNTSDSSTEDATDNTPDDTSNDDVENTNGDDSEQEETESEPVDEVPEDTNEDTNDDTTDEPSPEIEPVSNGNMFNQLTIDEDIAGPAFVSTGDMNNDGRTDLVVSAFGTLGFSVPNGTLSIYYQGEDLSTWEQEVIIDEADGVPFPNGTTLTDIDGDGDLDILSPSGFLVCTAIPFSPACGGIAWFEQTENEWIRHTILENQQELFYHHAEIVDFDGDGLRDLIITGEQAAGLIGGANRAVAQWFKGTPSGEFFESTPRSMSEGMGAFPRVRDIDGDGDLDIASAEYFHDGGSFAWLERIGEPSSDKPEGDFLRHVISDDVGPSIMFSFVPDFTGDGRLKAIGSNHTNTAKSDPDPWESGIYLFDIPADPKQPWNKTLISEGIVSLPGNMLAGQAAPGIFGTGDIDNDGDIDVAVSGDGDPRVFWIEQQAPGVFETHVIAEELGQAGGMIVEDLDQDGNAEVIVTSYDQNVLYLFQHTMP